MLEVVDMEVYKVANMVVMEVDKKTLVIGDTYGDDVTGGVGWGGHGGWQWCWTKRMQIGEILCKWMTLDDMGKNGWLWLKIDRDQSKLTLCEMG